MRTTIKHLVGAVVLAFASAVGCDEGTAASVAPREACDPTGSSARNDEVRLGLEATCASCHLEGAKGYFASLSAFESLLVADPRLVVPGDPDASELVRLLEGNGSGSALQMPLGEKSFAELDEDGNTDISVEEIRSWIAELDDVAIPTMPDRDAPTMRRISAEHVERSLRDLLGLTRDDFFKDASTYGVPEEVHKGRELYPVHAADSTPGSFSASPVDNFFMLGGGSTIRSMTEDRSVTPPFVQMLVPLSQKWCKLAIAKTDNPALFRYATATSSAATDATAVRQNIAWLHQRFHGLAADEEQVERVFEDVFVALETESGDPAIAWAGVCSYLVRHPRFLFY